MESHKSTPTNALDCETACLVEVTPAPKCTDINEGESESISKNDENQVLHMENCARTKDNTNPETTDVGRDQTAYVIGNTNNTSPLTVDVSVDTSTIKPSHGRGASASPSQSLSSACSVTASPLSSPRSSISSPIGSVIKRTGGKEGKVKTKRRGSAWNDDQTEFLMEIWARNTEPSTGSEELNHNAPVYRLIAKEMVGHGFEKSWEQCKTRIHTLKRAYKLTKDEVIAGATAITYCRHYEQLQIISGDNPNTTPHMLADMLKLKRKEKEANAKANKTSSKRKLNMSNKNQKRLNQSQNLNNGTPGLNTTEQPVMNQSSVMDANSFWYNQPHAPEQQQNQQLQQQEHQQQQQVGITYQYPTPQMTYQNQQLPAPPPYPNQVSSNHSQTTQVTTEVNNNEINIKQEKGYNSFQGQYLPSVGPNWATFSTPAATVVSSSNKPQQQTRDDLEKMRIDLEMRKVEVERNKLEMEERQRREERDHQYRMMQLLLFGLGQQNTNQLSTGQGVEQDVANTHNSTTLSRALENGLVPGGSHIVNEKGLSFNEI